MWLGESLHSTCVWAELVCVARGIYRTQSVLCRSSLWVSEVCLSFEKGDKSGVTGPSRGGNGLSGDVGVASCRPVPL